MCSPTAFKMELTGGATLATFVTSPLVGVATVVVCLLICIVFMPAAFNDPALPVEFRSWVLDGIEPGATAYR